MESYIIQGSEDTPAITLDKAANSFIISGRSLPEDVVTFYKPTLDWLNAYAASPNADSKFDIKLEYFNTASSKLLLDILMVLDGIAEDKGVKITVNWHFDKEDDDMQEAGEEYSELVSIPFTLIPYEA
jgi:SiaC family regulatory phosphoprotein